VAAVFGLPEGVDDRALLEADVPVVPHPGFGIDRLAHRAEDAQRDRSQFFGCTFSSLSAALMSERIAVGAYRRS
jgi:hypothetical protein